MVKVHFVSDEDGDYVYIEENDVAVEPEHLLRYLRNGIKKGEIKSGIETHYKNETQFIFDALSDKFKHLFVVNVKPQDEKVFGNYINNIRDLCDLSIEKRKVNYARIATGIMAGFMIIYASAPKLAKGIKSLQEKDYKYTISNSESLGSQIDYEKKIEESRENYSDYLRQRAESGDKDAIEEYTRYILEKQLEEQREKEEQERGYSR